METRTLFSYKGLEVKVGSEAGQEAEDLLSGTVVGSEGGVQYILRDIAGRIKSYGDSIRFLTLWRNYSLAAVIGVCHRSLNLGARKYSGIYLRFLSFRQAYHADIQVRRRSARKNYEAGGDSFRQQTLMMFSKPHLLGFPGVKENDRHIMYAYVESKNERSKQIIDQAGYEYIRSFLTVAFSRFRPFRHAQVSVATKDEYPLIRELMNDFYRSYSFYFDDYAFSGDRYFVYREGGKIIAGVSAFPTEYVIQNVPGVWGWVMMKILPFAPWYRRLFHPELFRFVSLGSLFHIPGREDALAPLLESVCAVTGHNTALTWVDDRGPLYDTLRNKVNLGALNRILNAKPGLVYARFIGYSDDEKEEFLDAPAFIAGFDFS